MTPKFIYFDLDDTLLDHKGAEAAALKDVHSHFGFFNGVGANELIDTYHHINKGQWRQYSVGEVTREQLQRNRFELTLKELELDTTRYKDVSSYYMECYRKHWEWIEGAREVFEAISQKYDVGILTNGFSETQKLKFKRFDLHTQASCLVISEDVGALKPDPRVFQYATELAGCSASEIFYIGDSYASDVIGGSQFGWKTGWYTTETEEKKLNEADFVFSDFRELGEKLDV